MPILKDAFDDVKDVVGDIGSDIEAAGDDVIHDFNKIFTGDAVDETEKILSDAGLPADLIEAVVEQLGTLTTATEATITGIIGAAAEALGVTVAPATIADLGAAIFGALILL